MTRRRCVTLPAGISRLLVLLGCCGRAGELFLLPAEKTTADAAIAAAEMQGRDYFGVPLSADASAWVVLLAESSGLEGEYRMAAPRATGLTAGVAESAYREARRRRDREPWYRISEGWGRMICEAPPYDRPARDSE